MNVIECSGLAKRYRRSWALRDCALAIPAGHVVGLVGPNGAGKTTLLNLAAGLFRPTAGEISVLGGEMPGSAAARAGIAFVAQDAPLYGHLPAGAMLRLAGNLNLTWDEDRALARLDDGSYGKSVASGEPIPDARLEADPAAELTIEEAREQESERS